MPANSAAIEFASPWKPGRGLRVRDVRYRAGSVQPRHVHEEPSLSLVVSGSLEESSRSGTYRAAAGCLVIKPAHCWHANHYGPRGARVVQITPTTDARWGNLRWDYGWQETSRLVRHVLAFLHEQPLAEESVECSFWQALDRMAPTGVHSRQGRPPRWWPTALEILGADSGQPVSVALVAQQVGVHPVHLARVCRQQLGCSAGEYLRQRRTLLAWRDCERNDDSLAAIAARTGFADQAHMTRSFRSVLGISPARLRRLARIAC